MTPESDISNWKAIDHAVGRAVNWDIRRGVSFDPYVFPLPVFRMTA